MTGKVGKIIIDIVLSLMFFIVAAILIDWIASLIFGTKDEGGADFSGWVLLTITTAITIVFAVWFYKYVHLHKKDKIDPKN